MKSVVSVLWCILNYRTQNDLSKRGVQEAIHMRTLQPTLQQLAGVRISETPCTNLKVPSQGNWKGYVCMFSQTSIFHLVFFGEEI
jgi:hypothetical protein